LGAQSKSLPQLVAISLCQASLSFKMPAKIIPQRTCATMSGEFCVFLIGMRINRPLKVHKWLLLAMAMPRMLRELEAHKELGRLGANLWVWSNHHLFAVLALG
jgi:hypothetical protein